MKGINCRRLPEFAQLQRRAEHARVQLLIEGMDAFSQGQALSLGKAFAIPLVRHPGAKSCGHLRREAKKGCA